MTRKLKTSKAKVKGWEVRFEDPYYCYQMLLEKIVKGYAFDDEELDFFREVERMIKSKELVIVRPGEDGYEELATDLIKKRNKDYIIEHVLIKSMPYWAIKYFEIFSVWQETAKKSENYIDDFSRYMGIWYDCEAHEEGFIFKWKTEADKTMFFLKFS